MRLTRPLREIGDAGERARGRQPAARAARRRRRAICSSWPRSRAPSSSSSVLRRAAPRRAGAPRRARAGSAQRHDRGARRRRRWPTASPTSSCAARCTTASASCAAPSCTCGSPRRWRRADRPRAGRDLADLAHHFAAAAPVGDPERAVDYNLRAAGGRVRRARLRRGGLAAAHRAAARHRGRASPRRGAARPRDDAVPRRALDRRARSVPRGRRHRPRARRGRAARPRGDRLRDGLLAPGPVRPGRARAARGGARRSTPADSTLRVGVLAGLARALEFQGEPARASLTREAAIAMARRLGDRSGLATVLMGVVLVAQHRSADADLRAADRGARHRRGARRRRDAGRGDGVARARA